MWFSTKKLEGRAEAGALRGGDTKMRVPELHEVLNTGLTPPFPADLEKIVFAMGCFWGAERKFWKLPGVWTTAVGYAGGFTKNPSYEEVCSGKTGHTEVVLVVYDPKKIDLDALLKTFWESHDPTQGMRQGNDVGTQYRSAIYTYDDAQKERAIASATAYGDALKKAGHSDAVTTEIRAAGP